MRARRRGSLKIHSKALEAPRTLKGFVCPFCRSGRFTVIQQLIRANFPEGVVHLVYSCSSCGHKSQDVFPLKVSKPCRLTFKVTEPKDLSVRIARSSSANVKIPEIKGEIMAGPAAQGYVTDVEGLLARFEEQFKDIEAAGAVLEKIRKMRKGELGFTLVIEDRFGNSRISSRRVKKERL